MIKTTTPLKVVDNKTIGVMLKKIDKEISQYELPIVTLVSKTKKDPFLVLISTMLSLRTKDLTTAAACDRLFARATTPQQMVALSEKEIEKLIYPVGFSPTKAKAIRKTCEIIISEHNGKVPNDLDVLTTFPGVGRKTANLVLTLGFNIPAMCVDTHVHRISNIWGYVKTKNPLETEMALRKKLPKEYWMEYNDLLVSFGQHQCIPASPKCSTCQINKMCPRIGVTRSR